MARRDASIPEVNLPRLEEAVCESLRKILAGTATPWEKRLDGGEVGECLRRLGYAIGIRYVNCTLSNFEVYDEKQKPVLERLSKFAAQMPEHIQGGGGLLLFGQPGTGKDHLVASLLKIAVAKHRLSVEWRDGMTLFEEARNAIKRDKEHEFISNMTKPHILALSDPQPPKGDLTDYQTALVRDMIDRRYRKTLSTWITTNIDRKEEAESLLTRPVLERLKDSSAQVFCDWESYRLRRKAGW